MSLKCTPFVADYLITQGKGLFDYLLHETFDKRCSHDMTLKAVSCYMFVARKMLQ